MCSYLQNYICLLHWHPTSTGSYWYEVVQTRTTENMSTSTTFFSTSTTPYWILYRTEKFLFLQIKKVVNFAAPFFLFLKIFATITLFAKIMKQTVLTKLWDQVFGSVAICRTPTVGATHSEWLNLNKIIGSNCCNLYITTLWRLAILTWRWFMVYESENCFNRSDL